VRKRKYPLGDGTRLGTGRGEEGTTAGSEGQIDSAGQIAAGSDSAGQIAAGSDSAGQRQRRTATTAGSDNGRQIAAASDSEWQDEQERWLN
jgi:hypothetical protein